MSFKFFKLLIIGISASLLGIVLVQVYLIKDAVESSAHQFSMSAKQVLINVAEKVESKELDSYYLQAAKLADSLTPENIKLSSLSQFENNKFNNDYYIYSNTILQENYKIASPFLANDQDSIEFKKLVNRKLTRVVKKDEIDGNKISDTKIFEKINSLDRIQRKLIFDALKDKLSKLPVYKRVEEDYLQELIQKEIKKRDLESDFEFGVFQNNLATKIKSGNFELQSAATFGVPIFTKTNPNSNFQLFINYTDKNEQIFKSVFWMGTLCALFTAVIIFTFYFTVKQLFNQRQISQIKTDFINNMTHEFKTPIATINLALDSLKNKRIFDDKEKNQHYLKMIRDENKRMHAQVENVLRISKLERNELNIEKERHKLHDLINDGIQAVQLIVDNRNGYIKKHFNASKSSILGNHSHLTNVIINLLDNAIKYSYGEPKIDIYTENVKNFIVLCVSDQGTGMTKSTLKKVFDKFYREHTGDVHNVKGHGLGLAYVKRIVEDHNGEINVESEKNKGSSFIIKLPLIT
ncbi:MAG: HAMP domain-containing sensor histidine kinase [Psychroflexus sp.]|jgi:two-component system phosphate regulon sensor histidine kinase PhoR|nr:HAMP domain-containing sensor histidine kinase [Psychroflexus sp.]MDR9448429.1 HAMP domain-containing sensor histidine kinase [Psychroflexus sp.]